MRLAEGFLIPHSPSMNHLLQGHAQTFEISFITDSNGKKEWHRLLGFPKQGVSFYHLKTGNNEDIGSITAIYGFLDFPVFRKKRVSNYFKFGSGLSYIENSFDRIENYRNVAIGSSVNLGFIFANHFEYEWKQINLGVGLSMVHASSGAFQTPNLGLNIASLDFTMSYTLSEKDRKKLSITDTVESVNSVNVLVSTGPRAVNAGRKSKYFIHTFQAEGVHRASQLLSYGVGLDLFYNEALPILDMQLTSKDPILQLGGKLLINLHLDKASLFMQVGHYIKTESTYHGSVYNRFGGRYQFDNNLMLNFSLKTHYTVADYFEFGVGYKFL